MLPVQATTLYKIDPGYDYGVENNIVPLQVDTIPQIDTNVALEIQESTVPIQTPNITINKTQYTLNIQKPAAIDKQPLIDKVSISSKQNSEKKIIDSIRLQEIRENEKKRKIENYLPENDNENPFLIKPSYGIGPCYQDSHCEPGLYYCSGRRGYYEDWFCETSGYYCDYDTYFVVDCSDYDYDFCDGNVAVEVEYDCGGGSEEITCLGTGYGTTCAYGCSNGECNDPPSTTEVTGYLKKSNGQGISNKKFSLRDCNTKSIKASDYTNSNGKYEINANAGNYELWVNYLDYDFQLTSCHYFQGDVSVEDVVFDTRITGKVVYSNGIGRSGVITRLKTCSGSTVKSDTTDTSGNYVLDPSDADKYKITMEILGNEYEVSSCETRVGDESLPNIYFDASLEGYIADKNNYAIQGAQLDLTTCGGSNVDSTTTNANGWFKVGASDASYYDLYLTYKGATYQIMDCSPITPDLVLTSPIQIGASLSGHILGANGNGKKGIPTYLTDCNENYIAGDTTDSSGYFDIQTARPDDFDFYFDYLGYTFKALDCAELSGQSTFTYPIVMYATLKGYINDLSNNPIQNIDVQLHDCSGNFVGEDATSSSGYFSVTEDANNYQILLSNPAGPDFKLVDQSGNDCFFIYGDANIGTININPTYDCSQYNYGCKGNKKLFNCFWDDPANACRCYTETCANGCTPGSETCENIPSHTVYVDVDNAQGKPIQNANVFLDNNFVGTTNNHGKIAFNAETGYRQVEVTCPDTTYCSSDTPFVNKDRYLDFNCNCQNVDSDNDGLTDEEEQIIGLDPYDANSNLDSAYANYDYSTGCFDFKPLFSGVFSTNEVTAMITQLQTNNEIYTTASSEQASSDIQELTQLLNIDQSKMVDDSRTSLTMLEQSDTISYVTKGNSVIYFFTDDETGVTSVFPVVASCTGQITGVLVGAGFGFRDDITGVYDLGKTVLTGLWHILTREKKLTDIWTDIVNIVKAVGDLIKNADQLVKDITIDIFGKGKWILNKVGVEHGNEYTSFQLGFFSGYVAGYIAENIVLFELAVAKAGKVMKTIGAGTKLGKGITNAAKALQRIAASFGGDVASQVSRLKIWGAAASWTSTAQDGLAILRKNIGSSFFGKKSTSYLQDLSQEIGTLYNRLDTGLKKSFDELAQSSTLRDRALDLIKKWDDYPDAQKGLVRIYDEVGESYLKTLFNRVSNDDIMRSIAKHADDIIASNKFSNGLSRTQKLDILENVGKIGHKYGDDIAAELISEIDTFKKATRYSDSTKVTGTRHGITVNTHYADDGAEFLTKRGLDPTDTSNTNKGEIGEELSELSQERNGWGRKVTRGDGFKKDNTNQIGIDRINVYPSTNKYIFVEAKFTSSSGRIGKSTLALTDEGRQLGKTWLENSLPRMLDKGIISNQNLFDKLVDSVRKGAYEAKLVVVKNTDVSGKTVLSSLDEVENLKEVDIIHIGNAVK